MDYPNLNFDQLFEAYQNLKKENEYLKRLNAILMTQSPTQTDDEVIREKTLDRINDRKSGQVLISKHATSNEKVDLFKSLFKGREDVFAVRWESQKGRSGYSPACQFEWQKPICKKPQIPCSQCEYRALLPLRNDVIESHLKGDKVVGLYPMQKDEKCWFLAVDFDKKSWREDVRAFLNVSRKLMIDFSMERSKSGEGAHLWLFFSEPLKAAKVRKLGLALLSKALEQRHEIGMDSFDRLFPNQDTMPSGGFGNLIALPLQKMARLQGNSVFIDENFHPYPDQWLYLSSIHRLSSKELEQKLLDISKIDSSDTEIWPNPIKISLSNGIHIKKDLPSFVLAKITELASFSNPEYFRRQAKRLTTSETPRIIDCVQENDKEIILPRGCLEKLIDLTEKHQVKLGIDDQRYSGQRIDCDFQARLRPQQENVFKNLLRKDEGILVAVPGFGKTVVAAAIIAKRKVNTLIIVHRQQLLEQWVEKLSALLSLPNEAIGQIGGGKTKVTGFIDIAMLQSINSKQGIKSFVVQYGQIIVDECHHIAAYSFEKIMRGLRAKYVLGLTATPSRKDGLHPIIEMQCGPISCRISEKQQAKVQRFTHYLLRRETNFFSESTDIQHLYKEMINDSKRNDLIFDDVLQALEQGCKPIIITERVAHAQQLAKRFEPFVKHVIVLTGRGSKKERQSVLKKLASLPADSEALILATGKYIGEGFDETRLNALFLTMPISWKGILQQYVGRLHREHLNKTHVRVYDYIDARVPVLQRMFDRRMKSYHAMGYIAVENPTDIYEQLQLF